MAGTGWAGTLARQTAMGAGWRVGVDPGEHLDLVTTMAFRHVRNPFITSTFLTAAGLALMAPNLLAVAAVALLLAADEVQVRAVEEPHLLRRHGEVYRAYCRRTGRFAPVFGHLTVTAGRDHGTPPSGAEGTRRVCCATGGAPGRVRVSVIGCGSAVLVPGCGAASNSPVALDGRSPAARRPAVRCWWR